MSGNVYKNNETDCYKKLMNQSQYSSNTKDNSKKMRIQSNTIFAFQDDHIYSNIYPDENEDSHLNGLLANDTFLIPNNNLNSSNFFSTVCDKSQWFNLNNTTTEKNQEHEIEQEHDLNISIVSITEEMEKNFRYLNEVDDDLNDAKLSVNDDMSMTSEKSNPLFMNMNLSTPINPKLRGLIESEEMRNLNTNLNTQHSFSSFLNFGTSNGSSFYQNEDKKHLIYNGNNPRQGSIKSITNQNVIMMNNNTSSSILSNQNNNEFIHANSVDFTNQSPYRLSYGSTKNLPLQNKYPTNNFVPYNNNNFLQEMEQSHNFLTPKNYMNQNAYPYSFCHDNNMYKSYLDSLNRSHITSFNPNQPFIPPNRFNPNEEKSVLDNLMILIKDQNGCRMIQKKLEEKKEHFLNKFYDKIKNNIQEIICDQFGNYVIQKFVECCSDKNIISNLLEKIKPKIHQIATNCYGTRGFQRILDFISEDVDYEILKEYLSNNVMNLIKDVNGNHVIQKVLQVYPVSRNHFLIEEIIHNILQISKLKQGGCIFQKTLDKANEDEKIILIEKIVLNVDQLINDEHGNFIIQHTVNLRIDELNERIFEYVKLNFVYLSKQKYSSNVIDKCILYEDSCLRSQLIEKMLELKCVGELLMDQYGNYVVQKALQVSNGINFLEMIEHIKKISKVLKQTNNGKKIHDNLIANYGEYFCNKGVKKNSNVGKKLTNPPKKEKSLNSTNSLIGKK